jgi:hypothetical protein
MIEHIYKGLNSASDFSEEERSIQKVLFEWVEPTPSLRPFLFAELPYELVRFQMLAR